MPVLIVALVLFTGMLLAVAVLFRKVSSSVNRLPVTSEWIEDLSLEHYRPMMRLLDGQDIAFLRAQPGFTPVMIANLRVHRCRVFRAYLDCLSADFSRVCTALRLVMLHSMTDRPDLASVLVHYRLMFACGLLAIQVRLFLYRWGIGTVDAASLMKLFDLICVELRSLVPMTQTANA